VVLVDLPRRQERFFLSEHLDNPVPVRDIAELEVCPNSRKTRAMRHQPPYGHRALAVLIELWPIRAHRRIQVEPAFPYEFTGQDRHQPLRAGKDHAWRVIPPGFAMGGVATPQIGNHMAVDTHVKCTAVIMRCREHLAKGLAKWLEFGGDDTLDVFIGGTHDTDQKPFRPPLSSSGCLGHAGSNQTEPQALSPSTSSGRRLSKPDTFRRT
jgi:hypothetical protein